MDPLSVTASIVGILAAAAKIGELLQGTIASANDAPQVLMALACEVREVKAALSALQVLLVNLTSAQPHRATLIQLDELIVTLTEAALTLYELDNIIAPLVVPRGARISARTRLRWTQAETACTSIVHRLQRHKASMTLMLNILQCASDVEASRSQSMLEGMVQQLLHNDQRLFERLQNLEDSFDARSIITQRPYHSSFVTQADDDTIAGPRPSAKDLTSTSGAVAVHFTFEDDLQSSRVYKMLRSDSCNYSTNSSVIYTQTWSIFSGLSLADISVLSVVALPLYRDDLSFHLNMYSFGDIQRLSQTKQIAKHSNAKFNPNAQNENHPLPAVKRITPEPDANTMHSSVIPASGLEDGSIVSKIGLSSIFGISIHPDGDIGEHNRDVGNQQERVNSAGNNWEMRGHIDCRACGQLIPEGLNVYLCE